MAAQSRDRGPTPVYLEGNERVFACALDWPGWCRRGKGEEAALEALAAYAPRYVAVAEEAGVPFSPTAGRAFDVVERLPGSATTEFGSLDKPSSHDTEPLTRQEARRLAALVRASWVVFDRVIAGAPAELRKGPRGGGRDRDKVVDHVLGAEASYARSLGVRHRQPPLDDRDAIAALRNDIADALGRPSDGSPVVAKGWLPRYAARRIAWHVLDHAWEVEDRSESAPPSPR
jgi:hypothetical protein